MTNYDRLLSRLDAFIRKYYANQLIRGTLVLLTGLLGYILIVSVGEYYLYMPVWLKITLVSAFVLLLATALIVWIIIPFSKMAKLGSVLSHQQAAKIIGKHFPEVSDKLLNILQLKQGLDNNASQSLIEASIDQKAAQISVVPIATAIDFSKNRKYLPYLLPLLLIGVFILVAAPNVFKDASARLLQPTKTFEKPAPFQFIITSNPLKALQGGDFMLHVRAKGDALPLDMAVVIDDERIAMQPTDSGFHYTFRNVTAPVSFRLYAAGYYSATYKLNVVQKPLLKSFKVQINYPAYIGKKDEVRNSLGDLTLPAGTLVSLAFVAEHTDVAGIRLGNGDERILIGQANMFAAQYRFMRDTGFTLLLRNKASNTTDSFQYNVKVIADQYPVIQMQEHRDSVSGKQILLNGTAGDDYGISRVLFHYEVSDAQNNNPIHRNIPLKVAAGALTTFQHYFDIAVLSMQPGQKLSYYIEAWDNDGVTGNKATRSEVMMYQMYNADQIDSAINENAQQINSGLSNSAQHTEKLQNEYKELQSKMLQSPDMNWEQQQSLQDLTKMQQQLQSQMESVKKRLEEQTQQSKQKQYSEDVKEKQEALKAQVDNLLEKELKEQMKKLEDLLKKMNKDNAFQTMKQLEQENKLFDMDLERVQELMKKLEMQMRMEDMANKLDELVKKQLELKDKTDKGQKDSDALSKEQEALKKELDKAMNEDLKEMKEQAKDMQQKPDTKEEEQAGKEAQEDMKDSKQELEQKQNSKASKSQSKAAQKMQKMSQGMRSSAGGMSVEEIEIDIKATRQILTNLIRLSFDQEKLMKNVQGTNMASQLYLANQKEQKRLHNNSFMIRDSLFALSKRVASLATNVNKETTQIEQNMATALAGLEDRRIGDAMTRQQYVMTHTNNLALMLNELLANLMQAQAQAQQSGQQGNCTKPGGKTPKGSAGKQLSDIITKQKELGDGMQQMKDAQQKNGNNPGKDGQPKEGKEGKQGGKEGSGGENGDAQQLAQMAARQAALRRQLQELNSLLNSKGLGNAKELKEIQDQMDRNETDLVNRRLSPEMQLRHKQIMTRLLQAEKSLQEQEQDDKRSSKAGEELSRPIPAELKKYMQDRQQLLDLYKTVPPQLKPYYRNMVEQYYHMIGVK